MFIELKKIKKFALYFFAICSTLICLICTAFKSIILLKKNMNIIKLLSLGLIMSNGNIGEINQKIDTQEFNQNKNTNIETPNSEKKINPSNEKSENILSKTDNNLDDIDNFVIPHKDNENTFKIIESHFGDSGIKFENFYVNNKANTDINIADELSKKPDINIKKDGSPQVLIYHTHTCESYIDKDQGFYYESFYPRTENKKYSVVRVGDEICKSLKKAGIGFVHDVTCHDSPSFNGSYKRSAETIDKNLSKYPSIQVTVDIHRDTIGDNEKGKLKPTFKFNGEKAAQIMIMSGCDLDGSLEFPDWEYNLRLALRLQKSAETLYPGMTRAMFFGPVKYNMNKTHASLLIEVGTEVNTLKEAARTGSLLGNALAKVLEELS